MTTSLGEAMFAAVTMLLLYVGLSHGFVSLLRRPVPFKCLDQATYGAVHRIGVLRIVNLLWTLVIAVVTQLAIILVLTRASDVSERLVLVLELGLAVAWTILLSRIGRPRASET